MTARNKYIRITTLPISLNILFRNQLNFLNDYFEVIGVSSKDNKHLLEASEREGVRVAGINISRKISPLSDLVSLFRLYKFIKKEKPLIIHTHTPKAGLLGILAARIAGVPYRFHTIAGLPFVEARGIKRSILIFAERITSKYANRVYYNSSGLLPIITDNKICDIKKLRIVWNGSTNGIDLNYFSPDIFNENILNKESILKEAGINKDEFVFCFVGRIVKEKGIHELVSAFINLNNKIKAEEKIRLLLIGPIGNDRDNISNEVFKTINEHPAISWIGRKDDIRPFLFISNVFVFPSYREGLPNVILQAGAMGLPCIVTDINGNNEIITDNLNGLIIPVKNEEILEEAMAKLLYNKDLFIYLKTNARTQVAKRYDQTVFYEMLLNEYKSCI